MTNIHETAIIDPAASISPEAVIGPYCVIGPDVEIGPGTRLINHVTIQSLTRIGCNNTVYPFAVLGADPQDKKFEGERTECIIGDGNEIREHVTIHRGTGNGGKLTTVGDGNLIMVGCHIAHDCIIGNETVIANQVMLAGHVTIEDRVGIGGGAGVHHYVTLGQSSFIGGLARVSRDVPPFMIVEGHPAEVRAVNVVAMSRLGYSAEQIDSMKDVYRRLFRDNGNMSTAMELVKADYSDFPAIMSICHSLEESSKGTHGRARESRRTDDKWVSTSQS